MADDIEHTYLTIKRSRVAILLKSGIVPGAIGFAVTPTHNIVSSFDPRCAVGKQLHYQSFETAAEAESKFNEALATSRDRGWTIAYNGQPLRG